MRIASIAGCAVMLACVAGRAGPITAQSGPTFVVAVQGAFARVAPSVAAAVAFPAVQGHPHEVAGRTSDGAWVKISGGWLPALLGELSGSLDGLPQVPPSPAAGGGGRSAWPSWIPSATPLTRRILQDGAAAGRNPRVFTVAGDSNSQWPRYLGRVAAGGYEPVRSPALRPVATRFDPSFTRLSQSVRGGIGAAELFDPALADPAVCLPDEGLFACELRTSQASIVFIQLGTGDRFAWRAFEANYRRMIDLALASHVLPVLVTKADDMESWQGGAPVGYINTTIRRLAQETGLPLLDFWAATRTLPAVPNPDLPDRPFTQFGLQDEWGYYFHLTDEGMALRILATLQTLDALARR
jgi:hypothetical protein